MLISRLCMFQSDRKYSHWKGASGTVIMKDVFTDIKSMYEEVIEGMGGMWDRCATDGRHPGFETGAEEAVIAWNAPQPYHPAADDYVIHVLNDVFGFDREARAPERVEPDTQRRCTRSSYRSSPWSKLGDRSPQTK